MPHYYFISFQQDPAASITIGNDRRCLSSMPEYLIKGVNGVIITELPSSWDSGRQKRK